MIITRSPLRITLGGGGTDFPFFFQKFNGNFVSAAIDKHVYVSINEINEKSYVVRYSNYEKANTLKEIKHPIVKSVLRKFNIKPGIEITSFADIKSGTGLGSSGAFTVALIKAVTIYKNLNYSNQKIAQLASDIEIKILNEPVGIQDPFISSLGSIRYFTINKKGYVKSNDLLKINPVLENYLEEFYLINSNQVRNASEELSKTILSKKKDKKILDNLLEAKTNGISSNKILSSRENYKEISRELTKHWKIKLERSPSLFHKEIDQHINSLLELGCSGAKLIGAGGGGFILTHCPNSKLKDMKSYLNINKMSFDDFKIDKSGIVSFEL